MSVLFLWMGTSESRVYENMENMENSETESTFDEFQPLIPKSPESHTKLKKLIHNLKFGRKTIKKYILTFSTCQRLS